VPNLKEKVYFIAGDGLETYEDTHLSLSMPYMVYNLWELDGMRDFQILLEIWDSLYPMLI
jgi:hypothetical protein